MQQVSETFLPETFRSSPRASASQVHGRDGNQGNRNIWGLKYAACTIRSVYHNDRV